MERKRKLPARGARGDPASKKRAASTTPEERNQTPTPAVAVPPPVVEESLPKSIAPGKPLPTLEEPQPENLSSKDFQTVSESGVLVESLHRSRQKWLSEGIFEKYWTKPVKKKGAPEQPPNNPPKDSMTKLGSCSITVEPHTFEATMYAIKETRPVPPPAAQQPMYRPIIQYGPPNGIMPPPPPPPAPTPQRQPTPQASPRPQETPTRPSPNSAPNNTNSPAASQTNRGSQPLANGQAAANHPLQNSPAPEPAADKSRDPVIQMLAERASTDPDLKALMRIVANGQASPVELKRFQNHIDELTRLQQARQSATPQPISQPPPPSAPVAQTNGHAKARAPTQSPAPPPPAQVKTPVVKTPAPIPPPTYQSQPQALRSKGPLPPSKPDISGVVFEFSGGNGDRYLFPKFSILEYGPAQGHLIASFLIVRKGSASDSPSYDPALDYYQPITIRLFASQPRQLDALQKVVAPPDEVRRYMDDIMDNMTRAEYVLLAMRLPKEPEQASIEKEGSAENNDQLDNQVLWGTTTTPVAAVKPTKRLLTEDEKYRNFITSVAATES